MRAASWIFLAAAAWPVFSQGPARWSFDRALASPGWPFGPPRNRVNLEGTLAHSDGETLSVELADRRVIRFRLTDRTRYQPNGGSDSRSAFRVSDVVGVEAEVDSQGFLEARAVRYVRNPSPEEQTEILQSPEILQTWRANVLAENPMDVARDDRRLRLVAKPAPIADRPDLSTGAAEGPDLPRSDVIGAARRIVDSAFERLPSFRAKQVTSLFHSTSNPVKWVPDGVVSAEVAVRRSSL
jgi:hypothetical protein